MENGVTKDKIYVSYSQYSMWRHCPLEWKLAYVDGHKPDTDSIHTVFGTSIHETVQDWLTSLYTKNEVVNLKRVFLDRLTENFKLTTKLDDKQQPIFVCDRSTIEQFHREGEAILDQLQKEYHSYFNMKDELIGIEVPLETQLRNKLWFTAFLDIVIKDRTTKQIKIYDLKTSSAGWNKWKKNDPVVSQQILLYKKFYSQQYGIPLDYINGQFLILSRKITPYNTKIIVPFVPEQGKNDILTTESDFGKFIDSCFTEQGEYKPELLHPTPSQQACRFCPFNNNVALCKHSFYLGKESKVNERQSDG